MSRTLLFSVITLLLASFLTPNARADDGSMHRGHVMVTDSDKISSSMDIYAPAMEKMHKNMMIKPSGDADVDFMRGMLPHHQGAVDMAKIVLEKGKDPDVKKLARDVIASQEKEIAFMKAWLAKKDSHHDAD